LVPEQKFVVKRLCLMQEEAESTFLNPDSRENHLRNNFWRIDRRNAKKLLQEESICFEAIETQKWDTENFVAVDDTNSQFRFVFRHPVTIAEKIKSFQLFKN
jgi:hypothetical protein